MGLVVVGKGGGLGKGSSIFNVRGSATTATLCSSVYIILVFWLFVV